MNLNEQWKVEENKKSGMKCDTNFLDMTWFFKAIYSQARDTTRHVIRRKWKTFDLNMPTSTFFSYFRFVDFDCNFLKVIYNGGYLIRVVIPST